MHPLVEPTLNQFLTFVLVLTRLSGLMLTLPVFGSHSVPMRIRAMLTLGMAFLITPMYWGQPLAHPGNLINLVVIMGREIILGLALGLAISIMLAGLQLTGQIIAQMSGMTLADVASQNSDTSVPVFGQLLDLTTLVAFLAIGGHRQVIAALMDTFAWMPPGEVVFSDGLIMALSDFVSQAFVLGLRAAAPIMIALLLSILVMGLISRTLPQLNIMAVGFSINAMVMLATLSVSLGAAALIFQEHTEEAVEVICNAIFETTG